jgi:glyoxylase-like metal-dependent hydrolase (beta-lactamase superfamily II)
MMKSIRVIPAILVPLSICLGSNVTNAQGTGAGDDPLAIVQLTDNVFRHGDESNVFVVTSEGIIVIDGTCKGGGQEWLKEELARRYDVPVKYVILSHDHESHICGTQVYSDTAVTIAHEKALPHILREGRNSAIPQVIFEDTMEIRLGGQRVVLYYFGPTHSDNLIQVHIPNEGVLVTPDVVRTGNKAIGLPDYRDSNVDGLIDALYELSKLDNVDIVVPGHGALADQSAFGYYRTFLVALRDRVLDALVAGRSIEYIMDTVTMDDFSDYENFEQWLRPNVISMWDNMYRQREPNSDRKDPYDMAYPIGFPIGEAH